MAKLKKNAVNQILFTMVDKTDFATIETSLASDFTVKRFCVDHGSAAASVSTLSRAVSKVGSGLYRLSLEAATCNCDYLALRIAHASAATQVLVYEMATANDADLSAIISDTHSAATKGNSMALVTQSTLSDIQSAITAGTDVASDAHSAAAKANSQLTVIQTALSDVESGVDDVYSLLSDLNSNIQSRVPKEVASKSLLSDVNSDLASKIGGITATITDSNISDIASAVIAGGIATQSKLTAVESQLALVKSNVSDVESGVDDVYSLLGSRVTKEVANASQLLLIKSVVSDTHSAATKATSQLLVTQSTLSDIDSAVTVVENIASDAHSAAAKANSQLLVNHSSLSDILSAATAVKAKTDKLTFTTGSNLDANIQLVHDVALTGDGSATPWGPV